MLFPLFILILKTNLLRNLILWIHYIRRVVHYRSSSVCWSIIDNIYWSCHGYLLVLHIVVLYCLWHTWCHWLYHLLCWLRRNVWLCTRTQLYQGLLVWIYTRCRMLWCIRRLWTLLINFALILTNLDIRQ